MRLVRVVFAGLVDYEVASGWQRQLWERVVDRSDPSTLLILEHPHVYTTGTRFDSSHLLLDQNDLDERGIPVHEADRGGSITYHGPGQLVAYPIFDLRRPGRDLPDAIRFLRMLEEATIRTARAEGVAAMRREGATGVWVGAGKLASIGVNVSRGVSRHGLALNVSPDLSYFDGMVPCGIGGCEMTSLEKVLSRPVDLETVKQKLVSKIADVFHLVPVEGKLEGLGLDGSVVPLRQRFTG